MREVERRTRTGDFAFSSGLGERPGRLYCKFSEINLSTHST